MHAVHVLETGRANGPEPQTMEREQRPLALSSSAHRTQEDQDVSKRSGRMSRNLKGQDMSRYVKICQDNYFRMFQLQSVNKSATAAKY